MILVSRDAVCNSMECPMGYPMQYSMTFFSWSQFLGSCSGRRSGPMEVTPISPTLDVLVAWSGSPRDTERVSFGYPDALVLSRRTCCDLSCFNQCIELDSIGCYHPYM